MALKSVLESIDDLPEEIKAEYKPVKIGDKDAFALDVEGIDAHPGVAALKKALDTNKKDKTKLFGELKEAKEKLALVPDDFDAEEWLRLKTEADADPDDPEKKKKLEQHIAGAKKLLEDKIKSMGEKHVVDLAAKDKIISTKDATIASLLVDDGLTKALHEAGVGKQFLKAAKAMLRSSVKVVQEEGDEEPRAIFTTDLGDEDIPTYIGKWAQSEEGKAFIPAPTGGDGKGSNRQQQSNEENPFGARDWSKTKQGALIKTDRPKAERLAKAAGFKTLDEAARAIKAPVKEKAAA
jgi:hypothetical protein